MSDTDEIVVDYDEFGPFHVHECLGAGGMAIVHRASIDLGDAGIRRDVALKRLLPQLADDNSLVQDFIREAKLSAQLQHPNIVKIVELGQVGREYFIAMELISGAPLMKVMRKAQLANKPAPIGVVLSLLMELCDALDYAHNGTDEYGDSLGVVHRDLSPSNLIVTDDGHVKVIDFGVAKAIAGKFVTNTGLIKGKLGYMSPEALAAQSVDARADLFAAGVMAWELLCARRLFKGKDELDTIRRVRSEPVPRPSSINRSCPGGLDALVLKALARPRDERWASAAEMRAALELVRRPYRDQSDAREVALWKRVMLEKPADGPRRDTDAETTHNRLVVADLEELDDHDDAGARLSIFPDEPSDPSIRYVYEVQPDELGDADDVRGGNDLDAAHATLDTNDTGDSPLPGEPDTPPPEISMVARGDTLDEPIGPAHAGEDGPSLNIPPQVLELPPVPARPRFAREYTGEDDGPSIVIDPPEFSRRIAEAPPTLEMAIAMINEDDHPDTVDGIAPAPESPPLTHQTLEEVSPWHVPNRDD